MNDIQGLCHTVWECKYHVVWPEVLGIAAPDQMPISESTLMTPSSPYPAAKLYSYYSFAASALAAGGTPPAAKLGAAR